MCCTDSFCCYVWKFFWIVLLWSEGVYGIFLYTSLLRPLKLQAINPLLHDETKFNCNALFHFHEWSRRRIRSDYLNRLKIVSAASAVKLVNTDCPVGSSIIDECLPACPRPRQIRACRDRTFFESVAERQIRFAFSAKKPNYQPTDRA